MDDFQYVGTELDVFAHATNWKSYVYRNLNPYILDDVLEVGAGIGAATQSMNVGKAKRWVCLEPDRHLAGRIRGGLPPGVDNCEIVVGALADFPASDQFGTILYMDVLEHIEDDRSELARAAGHLKQGGFLIVLAPALPFLYTPFDKAIGHYRRYTKGALRAIAPAGLREEKMRYLDAVGMMTSLANRVFLRSATPSLRQILFWDRCLVPISRVVDPILGYSTGRSMVAVWRNAS